MWRGGGATLDVVARVPPIRHRRGFPLRTGGLESALVGHFGHHEGRVRFRCGGVGFQLRPEIRGRAVADTGITQRGHLLCTETVVQIGEHTDLVGGLHGEVGVEGLSTAHRSWRSSGR